ncbi:DNA cytosine methyltransferase [Micromonospora sp. NPDC023888]|uniref:DNA cytosine methyltransferase n=1 Tax=Micromonospora sp. NPDC023888 TaxID=3155607 RepID=UPI0033C20677
MSIAHTTAPRIGSLCTGYGGLDMAVELVLGGQLTWYADTDRHARTVCAHHWPGVPNLGDIRTVDWTRVESVDVLTAGFPCQDISNAGKEWAELHWMQPFDLSVSARWREHSGRLRARQGMPRGLRNRRIDVALSATWSEQWIWLERCT